MHNRLTTAQVACAAAYALIFPISNLIGGKLMMFGILLTCPFLILAWPGGMLAVTIFGSEQAYIWGAGLMIFLQALPVTSLMKIFRNNAKA
ncbi:hypothetical protein DTO96_100144 [Ephemeroptericola cinctiostellae]|uniref:Uncharacterized protein n=1 Tax=Ephemeroptericola cinctiostellae TaxID=2268024 RepID=A0A345D7U9_9BURK|nr:hypothetical protein [Ephemeroptericola cinctiostellae]AXF84437.1 hypothetical protein DTO96_100144 [Ephemeroptericola cinctiostellae]